MVGFRGFMRIATRQIHWHRLTVGEGNVPFYSHLAVVSSTSRKTGIVLTSHTNYTTKVGETPTFCIITTTTYEIYKDKT